MSLHQASFRSSKETRIIPKDRRGAIKLLVKHGKTLGTKQIISEFDFSCSEADVSRQTKASCGLLVSLS